MSCPRYALLADALQGCQPVHIFAGLNAIMFNACLAQNLVGRKRLDSANSS